MHHLTQRGLALFLLSAASLPTFAQDIPAARGAGAAETAPASAPEAQGSQGSPAARVAVDAGLSWLAAHQAANGAWDVDGFTFAGQPALAGEEPPAACGCTGVGSRSQDVGMTGLALLAFLGQGHTPVSGPYKNVVREGVRWLRSMQDPDTGLIGPPSGSTFVYDHAIASQALLETYRLTQAPPLREAGQRAVDYILRSRNPYGVWRYDVPPLGDNDTSVTSWMMVALKTAEQAQLEVDPKAYADVLAWLDQMTDQKTGRVGYNAKGSLSSRVPGMNEQYPADSSEAMTAAGLLCRTLLGQDPAQVPTLRRHADLLLRSLPEWEPATFGCDMYYWYYASHAMFQMGGDDWDRWEAAMLPVVVGSQRLEGHVAGSWDPVGPWGYSGGRVYSTALMVLCLEAEYRYGRVVDGG